MAAHPPISTLKTKMSLRLGAAGVVLVAMGGGALGLFQQSIGALGVGLHELTETILHFRVDAERDFRRARVELHGVESVRGAARIEVIGNHLGGADRDVTRGQRVQAAQ